MELRMREGGGQGGTASCCVAKLGGQVAYIGKLGDDPEGRFCLQRLEAFGVDTEFLEIVPQGKTPISYIFITKTTGARTIIYEPSTLPKIEYDSTLEALIEQSSVILLDPETTYLGKKLVRRRDKKYVTVYDCEVWREGIEDFLAGADYFIPSAEFLSVPELQLEGLSLHQQLFRLKRKIGGELIITDGEKGAYYFKDNQINQVLPPPLEIADTLGAGDVFHGAFALAISKGLDLSQAVNFSVAVASLSCREYGGRKGIPDWEEAVEVAGRLTTIRL
jgi:sugar/nucleoside kinase (ribokinase family)